MTWAPDYITLAQAKAYLRISDTVDDTEIATAITAASRAVDRTTGRQFGVVASVAARTYEAVWDRHRPRPAWVVPVDDFATTTGLILTIAGTAVTDYTTEPVNAVAKGRVWESIVIGPDAEARPTDAAPDVVATVLWGWPAFPAAVVQATKLQTARFLARRDSPFGVAGSPSDGSELRLFASVDPDVRVALAEYTRKWGAP